MASTRNLPWAPVLAVACGLTCLAAMPQPVSPLPTPFPENRYQQMSTRSPFAVATATAQAAPTPGFAAQLYVDGIAHAGGTDFVGIKSRDPDQPNTIFLEVGKSTPDGMKIERVIWSDQLGKSTVEVTKAGEKATLNFDEATIKTASTSSAVVPGGPIHLPTLPGGRPMNFPMQSGQPQFTNRFFQPPQQQAGPGVIGDNNPLRRRVRGVIPSGQ